MAERNTLISFTNPAQTFRTFAHYSVRLKIRTPPYCS